MSSEIAPKAGATCLGCGTPANPDYPVPSACEQCPPRLCESCGEMDSIAAPCRCWIKIENMAPADVKALFAADGMFNVGAGGRLTVAEPLEGDEWGGA